MHRLVIFMIILVWQILSSSPAFAWKMPIEVSTTTNDGERVYNKLVIGIETGATDGFDNLWDAPAMLSRPDPDNSMLLRAYITPTLSLPLEGGGKKGGGGEEETRYLWKDIRGAKSSGDTIWEVTIDSVPVGKSVVISWDVSPGLLKGGERFVLKDNDKVGADGEPIQIDISQTDSYTFVSAGDEPRSLSLVLSGKSANKSSGSGSGFGCGTVKSHRGGGHGGGRDVLSVIVLFLPVIILRLLRLTQKRLSI